MSQLADRLRQYLAGERDRIQRDVEAWSADPTINLDTRNALSLAALAEAQALYFADLKLTEFEVRTP
jgi:hypothetical protein